MKTKFVVVLIIVILFLSGCKPSDSTIKSAISESLQNDFPGSWAGSLLGGKNPNIHEIEIIKVGKFVKDGKYYPVKVKCSGTVEADLLFSTEQRSFDNEGEFKVFKDDYGDWKAEYMGIF